jgi:L-fuconolactonase
MLNRDFLPDDLIEDLRAVEVDATVLVQSANTLADTRWMLELASTTDFVAGVVGWIPLTDLTATRHALDGGLANRKLCGVRHLNIERDEDWLVRPSVIEGLQLVAEHRPTTEDALLRISGVGRRKLEQYGDAVLALVAGDAADASDGP